MVRRRPGYSSSGARLQSRLRFPGQTSVAHGNGRAARRIKGNDGNVAPRTGPGGRNLRGLAERPPRDRRVVPVPGFGGSPVGGYRLWCFGLLPARGETCADTYRSPSRASHARLGPLRARPRPRKPPVRRRGDPSIHESERRHGCPGTMASPGRACRCVLEAWTPATKGSGTIAARPLWW